MPKLKHIIFVAFIIRLILIPFFNDDFNFWAARTFTSFGISGFNPWIIVYNDPTLYWINPWRSPPPLIPLVAQAHLVSSYFGNEIIFLYLMKLPLVFADLVTTLFLYKIATTLSSSVKKAENLAMLFAFNPVTILVSAIWGQTDPIPIMFTTIAVYFFLSATSRVRLATSGIFLGWGIAFKLYPVFILPVFVLKLKNVRKAIIFLVLSILPLAVFSLPFLLWDFEAYVNRLLTHNVGGVFPLFPSFSSNVPLLVRIVHITSSIALFAIAFFRKKSLATNLVLSFLALYFILGGSVVTNYLSWMTPFIILLFAQKNVGRFRGSWFLPFFAVPSMAWPLILSGPYNSVEGISGIFYWTYHWLREKIVVFRVLPFLENLILLLEIVNISMILYFFYKIVREPRKVKTQEYYKFKNSFNFSAITKNKRLIISSFLILAFSIFLFPKVVPFEPVKVIPKVKTSTFTFYDEFTVSFLNYQWWYEGDGTYRIHFNSVPSYIVLNATGSFLNRTTISRCWWYVKNGFFNSSHATIEFEFRSILGGATNFVIAETDGGRFEVKSDESFAYFAYVDFVGNSSINIAEADEKWHVFKIEYDRERRIYFDNELKGRYTSQETFSYLDFGNPQSTGGLGGSCSIDWVNATILDFPTGARNLGLVVVAIGGPYLALALLTTGLVTNRRYKKKTSSNPTRSKYHLRKKGEQPLTSVIILNFNGMKFLEKCLKSVLNTKYANFEVVFVDNASIDRSFEYVQRNFGCDNRLRITKNNRNLGFAEGNNIGAKMAKGKYLVFLNMDTEVDPNWLKELVDVLEANQTVAICQSKLLSLNNPGFFDSAGDFIDRYGVSMRRGGDLKERDKGQYDKVEEIFSARGAAMAIRRRIIKEVGLFDSTYFMTYEDTDLCWRTRLRGYKILFVPTSIVYHIGEVASPVSLKVFFTTRNRLMTLIKNYELYNLLRILPCAFAISISVLVAELLIRKRPELTLGRFRGILWNLVNFRYVWKERMRIQRNIRRVPDSQIMEHVLKTNLAILYWLPLWRKLSRKTPQ